MRRAVLLIVAVTSGLAGAEELEAFAQRVMPSVVMLKVVDSEGKYRGNGTGFFISADGEVVTNHHVVAAAPEIAVLSDGTERKVLGLLASDKDADVAIVRIEGSGYPPLPLGSTQGLARGAKVAVVGSPMGLSQTVSSGIVSALRPQGLPEELGATAMAKAPLVQITAPIAPGSSGSPVLTMDGQVIGVAQSIFFLGDLNFAVAVEKVKELRAKTTSGELSSLRPWPVKNLVLSAIFFSALLTWFLFRRFRGPAKPTHARR